MLPILSLMLIFGFRLITDPRISRVARRMFWIHFLMHNWRTVINNHTSNNELHYFLHLPSWDLDLQTYNMIQLHWNPNFSTAGNRNRTLLKNCTLQLRQKGRVVLPGMKSHGVQPDKMFPKISVTRSRWIIITKCNKSTRTIFHIASSFWYRGNHNHLYPRAGCTDGSNQCQYVRESNSHSDHWLIDKRQFFKCPANGFFELRHKWRIL